MGPLDGCRVRSALSERVIRPKDDGMKCKIDIPKGEPPTASLIPRGSECEGRRGKRKRKGRESKQIGKRKESEGFRFQGAQSGVRILDARLRPQATAPQPNLVRPLAGEDTRGLPSAACREMPREVRLAAPWPPVHFSAASLVRCDGSAESMSPTR